MLHDALRHKYADGDEQYRRCDSGDEVRVFHCFLVGRHGVVLRAECLKVVFVVEVFRFPGERFSNGTAGADRCVLDSFRFRVVGTGDGAAIRKVRVCFIGGGFVPGDTTVDTIVEGN